MPGFVPPDGSVDAHCHVFGPAARFGYAVDRTFTPRDTPKEEVFALQRYLGFGRAVIVQSSCQGDDHSTLLDALDSSPDRLRGVALITSRTPASAVAQLRDAGVRGFRLNFLPHLGDAPSPDEVAAVARTARDAGWHAAIHVHGTGLADQREVLAGLGLPLVIDHMGRIDLREGLDGPGATALRRLMDTGRVWVKLSGVDRLSSTGAPWDDAVELAARLAAHAPERVLWGTDYPHVNIRGAAPDDGLLTQRVLDIAPNERQRRRLLVENPQEVYEFPTSTA